MTLKLIIFFTPFGKALIQHFGLEQMIIGSCFTILMYKHIFNEM